MRKFIPKFRNKKPTNLAQCLFLANYRQMATGFSKWQNLTLYRMPNFGNKKQKTLKILPDSILKFPVSS
jgi:hypothetical protein